MQNLQLMIDPENKLPKAQLIDRYTKLVHHGMIVLSIADKLSLEVGQWDIESIAEVGYNTQRSLKIGSYIYHHNRVEWRSWNINKTFPSNPVSGLPQLEISDFVEFYKPVYKSSAIDERLNSLCTCEVFDEAELLGFEPDKVWSVLSDIDLLILKSGMIVDDSVVGFLVTELPWAYDQEIYL